MRGLGSIYVGGINPCPECGAPVGDGERHARVMGCVIEYICGRCHKEAMKDQRIADLERQIAEIEQRLDAHDNDRHME